ncbi:MAG: glycoside hydrolase family 2, partial [Planctomycetaceae bacterium]|nr:glycoside hydrolase family 2 [Planctomycetaceae bacterium]
MMNWRSVSAAVLVLAFSDATANGEWKPAGSPIATRWAKDVTPENVHAEYPRPQLVRQEWQNLNGLWEYAIQPEKESSPGTFQGEILVPFPVESSLSGVGKTVGAENRLWYRRRFSIPKSWRGKRIKLNIGACDWETTVWVNGSKVGEHRGGYDPFSFDITNALKGDGEQEIVVGVWDPSDGGYQPRGKQVRKPEGIWYTPTTGIWQTIWLEPVAVGGIDELRIVPDFDQSQICVTVTTTGDAEGVTVKAVLEDQIEVVSRAEGKASDTLILQLSNPKPWSPSSPHLYDLGVEIIGADGKVLDVVESYAALRKISLEKDASGAKRMLLNGKPLFHFGPLDQGFWPDGLYTAPTDEALKFDIEITKQLGFNMIRKHVKVEPARWYYWCDKLGMLVWQDMPSGDAAAPWDPFGKYDGKELTRSAESAGNYHHEWENILRALQNVPSIVVWVPFNEGWGQFETVAVTKRVQELDPNRLVNCASGGNDFPVGDI